MYKLTISIVTYLPDIKILEKTISSLADSLKYAFSINKLCFAKLFIVDNSPNGNDFNKINKLLKSFENISCEIISGHGNIGYGKGHNLGAEMYKSNYHLVLNPDVIVEKKSISIAVDFMSENTLVGLLTPKVLSQNGEILRLVTRYPSIFTLFLRGIGSFLSKQELVRKVFKKRMYYHEMKDINWDKSVIVNGSMISGCFMFFRKKTFDSIGGFSKDFFLYFEDFDISIRVSEISEIVYLPNVIITHFGGEAAKKGLIHIKFFMKSAFTFFTKYGWKLF